MIVRNKIWDEIKHSDANRICARKYANVQRRIALGYKIIVPLLAGICAIAVKIDQENAAFWASIIICVSTIMKAVFPQLILPDKDVDTLDTLQLDFFDYRNKLEDLFHRFDKNEYSEDEAQRKLNTLQKETSKRSSQLNKLVFWIPSYVDRSITKESEQYLNAIHNNKYE
ncbi:hypothetical protein FYJ72_03815 [Prevotella copri]|uniref:SLATT domain-containing protein n=1 Tax=Segatella copri TaxID=165179 RepID=A0A6I2TYH4_9BACT|nr:hypothetical protein [Segatella copri]MST76830.1 hypothetical protein [Segatella copri]